eukprot:IDg14561t1
MKGLRDHFSTPVFLLAYVESSTPSFAHARDRVFFLKNRYISPYRATSNYFYGQLGLSTCTLRPSRSIRSLLIHPILDHSSTPSTTSNLSKATMSGHSLHYISAKFKFKVPRTREHGTCEKCASSVRAYLILNLFSVLSVPGTQCTETLHSFQLVSSRLYDVSVY